MCILGFLQWRINMNTPKKTPAQLEYEALNKTSAIDWIITAAITAFCVLAIAFLSVAYIAAELIR
jgi:hypothetical protein